jgi:FAD/FMN-containing dehydrogenase
VTVVIERALTEAELVAIVKRAAVAGRPVRAVGRARRSRLLRGEEILVDLSGYRRVRRVARDRATATVEAGISLHELGVTLGAWGLSMENGGRRPGQTLGAAVSLGAHGSSAAHGGLATQVTALRLVSPSGVVIDCSAAEEPEIFDAARVGLGALGVISTVTVRCQPGFNLRSEALSVGLDEALANFDAYADGHEYFELSWRPGGDRARVVAADRTDEPADGRTVERGYRWFNRRRIWPAKVAYAMARPASGPALRRARELSAGSRTAPLFPIEVSVSAGDDIALSPAQGQPSVYIAGVAGLAGRPEWGSAHGLGPDALRALYPRWDEWQAVRDRLDPTRRFAQSRGQG